MCLGRWNTKLLTRHVCVFDDKNSKDLESIDVVNAW